MEHRETTRGRDLDITGLDYALLDARGPQQWPYPMDATEGRARLYADGVFPTPDGRARFVPTPFEPPAELPSVELPLRLTTGRLRDQWHGMSRTGRSAALFSHEPEPVLAVHPRDMDARGIGEGDLVRIENGRGEFTVKARGSAEMRPGDVFLAMHWSGRHLAGGGSNALMPRAIDPKSFQPELKHATVQVTAQPLEWALVAMGALPDPDVALEALAPLLGHFDYASCGLGGRKVPVTVLRAASRLPATAALLQAIDRIFGLENLGGLSGEGLIRYEDREQGISRIARRGAAGLEAVRLAGDATGAEWLLDWIAEGRSASDAGILVLAPTSHPPDGAASRGRVLCTCHDVAESQAAACFMQGDSLAQVQAALKCGTGCGSCVPALKRLEAATPRVVKVAA
jgi:assimilatory nitrate reductase catalytic subunit